MKNLYQTLYLTATLCLATLLTCTTSSCATTSQEEIENTIEKTNVKSDEIQMGTMALTICNNAENTLLQTDSLELCNILLPYTNHAGEELRYGNITLTPSNTTFSPVQLPAQTFTPWSCSTLPGSGSSSGSGSYAIIHGRLYTYNSPGTPFLLAQGPMYTPISATIKANETTPLTITIYPNCPLYVNLNGTLAKVLQPIGFSPHVNDWE